MQNPSPQDVYTYLDSIQLRPGMYVPGHDLNQLHTQLCGYYAALSIHGIVEPVPAVNGHFSVWLRERTGWSTAAGWAYAITSQLPDPKRAFDHFFELLPLYRALTPEHVASARVKWTARTLELWRYTPASLYFTVSVDSGRQLGHMLMDTNGRHVLTPGAAAMLATERHPQDLEPWHFGTH